MQLSAPTQCHILVLSLSPRLMCSDILQHSSISTRLWHSLGRARSECGKALLIPHRPTSDSEMSGDFRIPIQPMGHRPLLSAHFFTLTQNRALLPGSFTAAQSRAFLYFSPCKLEMIGTPLPFNQTPLLPLQPPAGFCFLPKNSLYHSLPLVKCPIDFLYILAAAGRDRLFNNPGLDEAAGIGLPHFCLRFLVQKYARVPEVPYFLSASRPLLACVDDNTAPPERVQQLESVRLQSWDTYTYLSFIRIYGNLTTVSFRSEQDMNSPRCLKDDKVIFFSPQAEENKHIVWQMQALLQSLLELL